MNDSAAIVQGLLAFVWAPLLVLAGVLDWACHRRLRIEHTSGLRESLLHLLMLALLGTAILGGLFLAPTAGLFALVLAALLLHEAAYATDLQVALASRRIPALEQWVHGFQHLLPWAGLAGLLALAPGQTLALIGQSSEAPDWALRLKSPLPPWPYTIALLAAALLFNGLPFLAEAWRSARAAARSADGA
ncbi:hypothetical protein [Pelomonas sp. Root1444]|uniref:hypothetical protein n=1 Tax=Pelomonas sp. Root1444 TaxID=1736464 RepID=UPI0007038DB4|nr:hypothetical protein [Pelomonas sp. Root1444]KQY86859.1 hypothetical protein ASD35_18990 [Pelomonas sp. Root1444]